MEDITDSLEGINPTDRVFKCEGPVFVKVRVARRAAPEGAPDFGTAYLEVSGSQTDEHGRALPHGSGHRIGPTESRVVMTDQPVQDMQAWLSGVRAECVDQVLRAARQQEELDNLFKDN